MDLGCDSTQHSDKVTKASRTVKDCVIVEAASHASGSLAVNKPKKVRGRPKRLTPRKTKATPKKISLISTTKYTSRDIQKDGARKGFQLVGLTVQLKFTSSYAAALQQILNKVDEVSITPPASTSLHTPSAPQHHRIGPSTPTSLSPRKDISVKILSIENVIDSVDPLSLRQRVWTDETAHFNMVKVCSTIHSTNSAVSNFTSQYHWYTDATPIDAIFPPGVPISAKEIHAYYPHHVYQKGVMRRLIENNYRGEDILGIQTFFHGPPNHNVTPAQMDNFQRSMVNSTTISSKRIGYEGNSSRELFLDSLETGQYLGPGRASFTVPTYSDLLRGLRHLPVGIDARVLTQCLYWYIQNRNAFSPRLQLNVLHTQALFQALRQPLQSYGTQNLDRNALFEWRTRREFERTGLQFSAQDPKADCENQKQHPRRSRLHINLDQNEVKLQIELPIRHVLTFPFLALHGVMGEMLKLGIHKAKRRKAEREEQEPGKTPESMPSTIPGESENTDMIIEGPMTEAHSGEVAPIKSADEQKLAPIPKRPRPTDESPPPESSSKRHRQTLHHHPHQHPQVHSPLRSRTRDRRRRNHQPRSRYPYPTSEDPDHSGPVHYGEPFTRSYNPENERREHRYDPYHRPTYHNEYRFHAYHSSRYHHENRYQLHHSSTYHDENRYQRTREGFQSNRPFQYRSGGSDAHGRDRRCKAVQF